MKRFNTEAERKHADTLSKRKYTQKVRAIPLEDRPPVKRLECIQCHETKRVSAFRIDLTFQSGYSSRCAKCARNKDRIKYNGSAQVRSNAKIARDKYRGSPHGKLKELDYLFRTKFGITAEDYFAMLEAQDQKCALCAMPPVGKYRLAVDHDHKTGKVRGLLCIKCNSALERFDACEGFLQRVADYLKNPPFEQLPMAVDLPSSEAVN